jgi:putrescine aminotransferase
VSAVDAVEGMDVAATYRRHLSSGKVRLSKMTGGQVEVSSHGSLVIDATGTEFLDCGGYGVFLLGHCHPRVVSAVQEQAGRLPLVTRVMLEPTQAAAAEALAGIAPAGLDRVYFGTAGADVVEAALKLARLNGKRRFIGLGGGFHGKTYGALSVSGNEIVRAPFAPLLPSAETVPFDDVDALRTAVDRAAGEACVVVEPIQGEGGVLIPTPGYLAEVAKVCADGGALLVLDEIATGLGRTGLWWESEREGVVPDMILTGKPLSGGVVPVGAILASDEVYAPFDRDPHIHSATFAGAAIAMAAVRATVEVLGEEDVPGRARALGARLRDGLDEALAVGVDGSLVREVRGAGLLIGIECDSPQTAGELEIELMARKVIPNHCLNHHAVVRLTPPVCLTDEEVDWLLDATAESIKALADKRQVRKRQGRRS